MNWLPLFLVLGLVTVNVVYGEESESIEELPLAEACNVTACLLPDCRCSGTDIPGGLAARDTPQFVLLTFDDGINILNIETYRRAIYARRNSNNCPIGVTFYVSHEYTNYELVNELHQQGFEIALHSITHQIPQSYWADASLEDIVREFADQKKQMNEFANIPSEDLQGMRIPFLQMNGNNSFQMMSEHGLLYDSTWGTINSINPGLWPYTLDYASTQECLVPPCPTASIPGVWELPMVSWLDLAGSACSMVDSCFNVPDMNDEEAWFHFIVSNFERHYLGNRAPFGFFVHEWYVSSNPVVERALIRFMDMINKMHDVFMVNSKEVIEWVKNPTPINEYRNQDCRLVGRTVCDATACGPLKSDHTNNDYWMTVCGSCPNVYPWIGNPLGL